MFQQLRLPIIPAPRRPLRAVLALAAACTLALAAADPAGAVIDGGHDGQIFLAVSHDGGILHDATVSTDGHFAIDRFSIEGPGLNDVPDHSGRNGVWRFDLIGHTVSSGSVVCGQGYLNGRSLGRPCVTVR